MSGTTEIRPRPAAAEMAQARRFVWRIERLLKAGFEAQTALTIARDERYDLHELLELVAADCPPYLAARILAPLGPA
jgi:hypothetical protein